jgi:hypothetical protein
MEEKLPLALRFVVELIRLLVFGDVAPEEPSLVSLDPPVGLVKRHPAGAEALHLAPHQGDAALEGVDNLVLMAGLAVLRHDPLGWLLVFASRFGSPLAPSGFAG